MLQVVSCDEKTGIQALERQITPMNLDHCERVDNSYERHGTQCLIANFDIASGKIIAPTIGDTRTEEDFKNHVEQTVQTKPKANWVFVVDQLNTHMSEALVLLVLNLCGITGVDVGEKGKHGVLKNMQTRKAFLEDGSHRIRFVYTPKHASWLNQVEIWFSILVKRLLKRLSTKSTQGASGLIIDFGTSKSAKIESLPSAVYSFGRHGSLSSRLRRKLRILLRHLAPVCLYGVKI